MNTVSSHWRYDLFKLIVTLVLLIILLISLKPGESSPIPSISGETDIHKDIDPDDSSAAPLETSPPDEIDQVNLPPLPESPIPLLVDETQQVLLGPDGQILYELDMDNFRWVPQIPEDIISALPEGHNLVESDPSGWSILDGEGMELYTWDIERQSWAAVQPVPPTPEEDCPVLLPARLVVGGRAKVLYNLNMRTSPGIKDNWMLTNVSRTELMILSGPVCILQEGGAYLWWEVENPSGLRGWSAEAHQAGSYYFLEPVAK
jgi:hypothetical protein